MKENPGDPQTRNEKVNRLDQNPRPVKDYKMSPRDDQNEVNN